MNTENTRYETDLGMILSAYGPLYSEQYHPSLQQWKAIRAITSCRTNALGGHITECDHCGHRSQAYNSCRNKHCPKCQFLRQEKWADHLKSRILPVKHFHFVFTIPQSLHSMFYLNQKICYDLLFKAAWRTINKSVSSRSCGKMQTAAVAMLHTWTQTLTYHPHIHMLVPAGALTEDQMEWIPNRKQFFAPVKVTGAIFRGILLSLLKNAIKAENIKLPENHSWESIKKLLYVNRWIVFAQKPLGGVNAVINYLGKYTHRVAISNARIIGVENDEVRFTYKDSRCVGINKTMKLPAMEFIRRFLMHILPENFYKIRYFGIMASIHASTLKQDCVSLIGIMSDPPQFEGMPAEEIYRITTGKNPSICPICQLGRLIRIAKLPVFTG
jgi:hypothetical protein